MDCAVWGAVLTTFAHCKIKVIIFKVALVRGAADEGTAYVGMGLMTQYF